ncbi:MAG: hypothetical protein IH624_01420 [Phycisphaerae bacterium]|nr:hypothetical protein [Phycisphaerae bacterium]
MKEIDFIPEWYRAGRKRRGSYHRQYTMIACLFVALLAWNYAAGSFLAAAKAAVDGARTLLAASAPFAQEYAALKEEIKDLSDRAEVLECINTPTALGAILGELSCLIGDRIILSSLEISAEPLQSETSGRSRDAVVLSRRSGGDAAALPGGDVCTKVVLAGIAADAADVAALIAAMEKSNYFCRIIPGYSRNKDIRGCLTTEFQITAHVADYLQTNKGVSP